MARSFVTAGSVDVINGGDLTAMDGLVNFSIAYWGNRVSTDQIVVGRSSSGTSAFWLQQQNTRVVCLFRDGGTQFANWDNTDTGWHHYACVFDGSQATDALKLKFYFDAVEKTLTYNNGATITAMPTHTADFKAGESNTIYSDGDIAEVRTWDVSLSAGDIYSDFAGKIPRSANLIQNWPIGYGSPEPDLSGNGNNGTIGGSPAISDHPPVASLYGYDDQAAYVVAAATGPPVGSLSMSGVGR